MTMKDFLFNFAAIACAPNAALAVLLGENDRAVGIALIGILLVLISDRLKP